MGRGSRNSQTPPRSRSHYTTVVAQMVRPRPRLTIEEVEEAEDEAEEEEAAVVAPVVKPKLRFIIEEQSIPAEGIRRSTLD